MTIEDKQAITDRIIAALREELDGFTRAVKAAQSAATDPDSKAENKYDTRNLEASYLARGVAFRLVETQSALTEWQAMPPKDFSAMHPVDTGALVVLEGKHGPATYFLGPGGGGCTVSHGGHEVTVITVDSPLGRQLRHRREGEMFLLESGPRREPVTIAAVF